MEKFPKPGSNPLALIRELPTQMIPINKIKADENIEPDDIFTDKYAKHLNGQLKAFATRINLNNIRPGFYKPTKDGLIHVCDAPDRRNIEYMKDQIRLGDRPALHLYHNINTSDSQKFLCPDDVSPLLAYEELGIRMPPVLILGSRKSISESCYVLRGIKTSAKEHRIEVDSFLAVEHPKVPALIGLDHRGDHQLCFDTLLKAIMKQRCGSRAST